MKNINNELFDYIYNEMGATYLQNPSGVESNLENAEKENLEYLGTYFPRSYAEAYTIYCNIFNNKDINYTFRNKEKIKILDIGSGTGGSLLGLIHAICDNFTNKNIEIISIDGNRGAIDIQYGLINMFGKFINLNKNKLSGSVNVVKFKDKTELNGKLSKLSLDNSIDIMQSFKVVNEFYRKDYNLNKGMYSDLLELGEKWLRKSGILCIVDVTNKIQGQNFASILFNEEIRTYFNSKTLTNLVYVIPKCCGLNYKTCNKGNNCFSRRTFTINFDGFTIPSKVNYKLFIKEKLGSVVLDNIRKSIHCESTCYCKDYNDEYNCTKLENFPYILD